MKNEMLNNDEEVSENESDVEAQFDADKERVIAEIAMASSFEDLAVAKSKSLDLSEDGVRQEVHGLIVKRFEQLLRERVHEIRGSEKPE